MPSDLVSGVSCFSCMIVGVVSDVWVLLIALVAWRCNGVWTEVKDRFDKGTWVGAVRGYGSAQLAAVIGLISVPGSAFLMAGIMWSNAKSAGDSTWGNTRSTEQCILGGFLAALIAAVTTVSTLRYIQRKHIKLTLAWIIFYYLLCSTLLIANTTNWNEKWQDERTLIIILVTIPLHAILEAALISGLGIVYPLKTPPPTSPADDILQAPLLEERYPYQKEPSILPHSTTPWEEITLHKPPEGSYGVMLQKVEESMVLKTAQNWSPAKGYEGRKVTHVNGGPVRNVEDVMRGLGSGDVITIGFGEAPRKGVHPVVERKSDGRRGEVVGIGDESLVVKFEGSEGPVETGVSEVRLAAAADFLDVRTTELAPSQLSTLSGRIVDFSGELIHVDFGPDGSHALLPAHLKLLTDPDDPAYIHVQYPPNSAAEFSVPTRAQSPRYFSSINDAVDGMRIAQQPSMPGVFHLTDPTNTVIKSVRISRSTDSIVTPYNPPPQPGPASLGLPDIPVKHPHHPTTPLTEVMKPSNRAQFRSLLSQFYMLNNPERLRSVDDVVDACYGIRGGPREFLARMYLTYPEAVTRGDLRWLEALVSDECEKDSGMNSYAVFGFSDINPRVKFHPQGVEEEGLPVYATRNGQLSLFSSRGHWVVCAADGEIILHSSGEHSGTKPSQVWLWNTVLGPDPAVSLVPAVDPVTAPSRRTFEPVPEDTVTYTIPDKLPSSFYPRRKVTFHVLGKQPNAALGYRIEGAGVSWSTQSRVMLGRDDAGYYLYFADRGLESKVHLPRKVEGVLGALRKLCQTAGVEQDLSRQYKAHEEDWGERGSERSSHSNASSKIKPPSVPASNQSHNTLGSNPLTAGPPPAME